MIKKDIYDELLKLIDQALLENEVPIASVIVENNNIIGKGYNKVEKTQNFMNHAEVIAINQAMNFKHNWRLDNCILYTTLEPCSMCKEIIKNSRIKKVIYLSKQNNEKCYSEKIEYIFVDKSYFAEKLKIFFRTRR